MIGRFDVPGDPDAWAPAPLDPPAYQWTAPREPESIYRAPETGSDPLESLARFQRMLDDLSREQRQLPHEIAASDGGTLRAALDALLANIPSAEPEPPRTGEIGSLLSLPIVIDDTLPSGRVELRDRGGNATRAWRLEAPAACAGHTGGVDSGMPERFVAIDPASGGMVTGRRGEDGRLHIDHTETVAQFTAGFVDSRLEPVNAEITVAIQPDPELFLQALRAIGVGARSLTDSFVPLGESMRTVAQGLHSAVRQAVIDPELEAARHWPAPSRAVCAHVCGADADHRCDARATTSLRFTLPSGGLRDLPLCGPCAQAESDLAAAQHDD